jgi:hypothetical protein
MRVLGIFLLLASSLCADVLVLKGGGKVPGRIVDKTDHFEVTSDGVLRTYLKDEVDKVVTSPKEFLGDSDKLFEEARADYKKALDLVSSPAEQNAVLKGAIAKVARAREAYSAAMDLFPEDGNLGKQIMLLMQLMRLLRERVHLDESRGPSVGGNSSKPAPPTVTIAADDALTTLLDPAKRNDPARRAAAIVSFRNQKTDLAYAAIMFLSKSDAEMKLEGATLKAAQEYFEKPWLKDPSKLTPEAHLLAAQHLAGLRGKADSAAEALLPFAIAHLSGAAPGPDVDKAAKTLGLVVQNGMIGTLEGHAVRDLGTWVANGEFDLAVMAFVNEYRAIDTPAVRYVWSYALLRQVQAKKKNFDRPVSALETIKLSAPGVQEHLAALARSIKAVAICNVCGGAGKLRCTNCHGKKETRFICTKCKGKGHTISSLGAELVCGPCKATGIAAIVKCEKCKDGYFDCKQRDCKQRAAPEMDEILASSPCPACEGRGLAFRNAAVPCRSCLGLGQKLVPKQDPAKVLP